MTAVHPAEIEAQKIIIAAELLAGRITELSVPVPEEQLLELQELATMIMEYVRLYRSREMMGG